MRYEEIKVTKVPMEPKMDNARVIFSCVKSVVSFPNIKISLLFFIKHTTRGGERKDATTLFNKKDSRKEKL